MANEQNQGMPERASDPAPEPLGYAILDKLGRCSYRWWPSENASVWHKAELWDKCYPHLAPYRLVALAPPQAARAPLSPSEQFEPFFDAQGRSCIDELLENVDAAAPGVR